MNDFDNVPSPTHRLSVLDGLRSLVIFVMLVHFTDSVAWTGWAAVLFVSVRLIAVTGLDVFFVLSGFLITGILLDTKTSPSYFRTFYARRFLRIFPLYYGFLAVYLLVLPALVSWDVSSLRLTPVQHIYYWGYLINVAYGFNWPVAANTGHLWSLAVEEQFYLFWPAVVYFCDLRRLRWVCLACLVIAPVSRVVLVTIRPDTLAYYTLTVARLDALALGGLIALALRQRSALAQMARWARPVGLAIVLLIACLAFLTLRTPRSGAGLSEAIYLTASAYLAAVVLVLTLAGRTSGLWHRTFSSWGLRQVGLYSYGIYVIHGPLAYIMNGSGWLNTLPPTSGLLDAIRYCAVMVPFSIMLGALIWHVYERPWLTLRRFLPYGGSAAQRSPQTT